jgi:crotonobetainyl-CoA:carnitine CoA-transferase CaiB-like acyl-CoA transferase
MTPMISPFQIANYEKCAAIVKLPHRPAKMIVTRTLPLPVPCSVNDVVAINFLVATLLLLLRYRHHRRCGHGGYVSVSSFCSNAETNNMINT